MLNIIAKLTLIIWTTSSLVTIAFYFEMQISRFLKHQPLKAVPIGYFLYAHFCPIVHTKKALIMLNAYADYLWDKRKK